MRVEDLYRSRNPGPFSEQDPASINYWPSLASDPATHAVRLRAALRRGDLAIALALDNALNSQPTLQRIADTADSSLFYGMTLRPRTLSLSVSRRLDARPRT